MKKVSFIQLTFLLSFLMSTFGAIAQGGIVFILDDGCDPCDEIPLDENGNATLFTPPVYVHLNPSNQTESDEPTVVNLPPNTEPLYLEFKHEDNTVLIPLTIFISDPTSSGPTPFHSTSVAFTVNFTSTCSSGSGGVIQGGVFIDYSYRLVDQNGNDYPFHDTQYSNPNGIFSCQIFNETCPDCPNKGCQGEPTNTLIYNVNAELICSNSGGHNGSGSGFNKHTNGGTKDGITLFSVQTNPFGNNLEVEYTIENAGEVNLTIFNAQGQLMLSKNTLQGGGVYRERFDTNTWLNGIYYAKFQSDKQSQVVKLLKIN